MIVTELDVINVPAPQKTTTYQPVSNLELITSLEAGIEAQSLTIVKKRYELSKTNQQMFGHFQIQTDDTDYNLAIGFRNSYNKSLAVGITSGAQVLVCSNLAFGGDFIRMRKHTTNVLKELNDMVDGAVGSALIGYKRSIFDMENMKKVSVSKQLAAELIGRLYMEEKLVTNTQLSIIRNQYETNKDFNDGTLFGLYNNVTEALKRSHPANRIKSQIEIHNFFTKVN